MRVLVPVVGSGSAMPMTVLRVPVGACALSPKPSQTNTCCHILHRPWAACGPAHRYLVISLNSPNCVRWALVIGGRCFEQWSMWS